MATLRVVHEPRLFDAEPPMARQAVTAGPVLQANLVGTQDPFVVGAVFPNAQTAPRRRPMLSGWAQCQTRWLTLSGGLLTAHHAPDKVQATAAAAEADHDDEPAVWSVQTLRAPDKHG